MSGSPERLRIAQAYCKMAIRAKYRPGAPSDGCGGITASEEYLRSEEAMQQEAIKYADAFIAEEDTRSFWIGVSHYESASMLVYAVELARLSCAGPEAYPQMESLIKLINSEIKKIKP